MAMKPRKGMGFANAAASVAAKQNVPAQQAAAIIGAGKANASPAAKKANPNLLKTSSGKPKAVAKKAVAKKAVAKKATPKAGY
jgi:peroxiredoxin Q/BCP